MQNFEILGLNQSDTAIILDFYFSISQFSPLFLLFLPHFLSFAGPKYTCRLHFGGKVFGKAFRILGFKMKGKV